MSEKQQSTPRKRKGRQADSDYIPDVDDDDEEGTAQMLADKKKSSRRTKRPRIGGEPQKGPQILSSDKPSPTGESEEDGILGASADNADSVRNSTDAGPWKKIRCAVDAVRVAQKQHEKSKATDRAAHDTTFEAARADIIEKRAEGDRDIEARKAKQAVQAPQQAAVPNLTVLRDAMHAAEDAVAVAYTEYWEGQLDTARKELERGLAEVDGAGDRETDKASDALFCMLFADPELKKSGLRVLAEKGHVLSPQGTAPFTPWGLAVTSEKQPGTLYVNPPSGQIHVVVEAVTADGTPPWSCSGSGDRGLDLTGAPPGQLTLRPILTLGNSAADREKLEQHVLPESIVNKNADGTIDPPYVDLKLEHTMHTFMNSGIPIDKGKVECKMALPEAPDRHFVNATDDTGRLELVLPATPCISTVVTPQGGKPLPPTERPVDPLPRPEADGPKAPTPVEVDATPTNIMTSQAVNGCTDIVYLGDISSSMSGTRVQQLKSGLMQQLDHHCKQGTRFAMGAWNTETVFPTGSLKWLGKADEPVVRAWIASLTAAGCTRMKQAMTSTLENRSLEPAPKRVYCACDGDITSFTIETWKQYREKFPKVDFEFGLFGDQAAAELHTMGQIGGGGCRVLGDGGSLDVR